MMHPLIAVVCIIMVESPSLVLSASITIYDGDMVPTDVQKANIGDVKINKHCDAQNTKLLLYQYGGQSSH